MKTACVLLDLDGTIINDQYETTVHKRVFVDAVETAQERGIEIGLSSDSPMTTLQAFASEYGITGPLVCEKGNLVVINGEKICTNTTAILLGEVKHELYSRLLPRTMTGELTIAIGAVNALTKTVLASNGRDNESDAMVLINGLREASFSCFCLERDACVWKHSPRYLEEMSELALDIALGGFSVSDVAVDRNPTFSICIIHHRLTHKLLAIPHIRKAMPGVKIFMVGDSMSDYHDNSITHCAVSNASDNFKKLANIIASRPHTKGVIEILEKIAP